MFADQYKGGAELTTEAIIKASLFPCNKVLSQTLTVSMMEEYKHVFWIFGNFAQLQLDLIPSIIANMSYSILEYDYKFCKY